MNDVKVTDLDDGSVLVEFFGARKRFASLKDAEAAENALMNALVNVKTARSYPGFPRLRDMLRREAAGEAVAS